MVVRDRVKKQQLFPDKNVIRNLSFIFSIVNERFEMIIVYKNLPLEYYLDLFSLVIYTETDRTTVTLDHGSSFTFDSF